MRSIDVTGGIGRSSTFQWKRNKMRKKRKHLKIMELEKTTERTQESNKL